MKPAPPFNPPFYLRNPFLQTYLASSRWRKARFSGLSTVSQEVMITTPTDSVRLLAQHSVQEKRPGRPRGLVVLIHGWEGSADSAYVLSTGSYLYARGYDILRLNMRDHGPSHHMNRGLFYASRLGEVFEAVQVAVGRYARGPAFLVGFSLGGNFALRIGLKMAFRPIPGLRQIVCISPVLDPARSTAAIDRNPLLRRYFTRKWFASLKKKQQLFPRRYQFDDLFHLTSCMSVTRWLISRHSPFDSVESYFSSYTLLGSNLQEITIPLTLITAHDDPVIPFADFAALRLPPTVNLISHARGGHNGFIENMRHASWFEKALVSLLR